MANHLDKTIKKESVDMLHHDSETPHTDGVDKFVGETPKMEQEQEGKETPNTQQEKKPESCSDWMEVVVEEKEEEKDEESEESEVEQMPKKMVRKESDEDGETLWGIRTQLPFKVTDNFEWEQSTDTQ